MVIGKGQEGREEVEGRRGESRKGKEGKGREGNLAPTVISKSRRLWHWHRPAARTLEGHQTARVLWITTLRSLVLVSI